ncbi:hypothetical protein [Breznakiella homolactica]|uniref:Uncharacterized protein n=1 Tax=Breznakiella homolactica TaxID=2798577 RepID=A0A7T7XK07_9SPIR|nr:hypothetical protein [Breznakiella homolactica]QQO07588.1 hypothetical protein JFL75_11590 [Breznakiella homolactica]
MDHLKKMRSHKELAKQLSILCNIDILKKFDRPMEEHFEHSLEGKVFARHEENEDKCYLLEDGSVGFFSDREWIAGRVAESMEDFLTYIINVPELLAVFEWPTDSDMYESDEALEKAVADNLQRYNEDELKSLAGALEVPFYPEEEIAEKVMRPFYEAATREPLFTVFLDDNDAMPLIDPPAGAGSVYYTCYGSCMPICENYLDCALFHIAAYLRDVAKEKTASMTDDQLRRYVNRVMKQASAFGISSERAHGKWAYMTLATNGDLPNLEAVKVFMKDPEYEHLGADGRVDLLMKNTITELEKREAAEKNAEAAGPAKHLAYSDESSHKF